MKAIVHDRYGDPRSVLRLADVDAPVAGEGQVLVRVHAAGVNKGDWLIAAGQPYIARPSYGMRRPKRPIAGLELAGVVEAAGPDAARFQVGDAVFGWCDGAFAEYAAVDQGQLAPKPAAVTSAQAATVPISGFAALQALRDVAGVRSGQHVLVIGASGGVGSYAVQIAKAHGAEVTGVCSTPNVDMVRSLGADHVVDYTRQAITDAGRRYDVIIDIAGNRPISLLREALAPDGTLVIVGGTGGAATMGFGRTVRAMLLSPFVRQQLRSVLSTPNQQDLHALAALIESGEVTPAVDRTYLLADAPRAVAEIGSGRSRGKRAVTVLEAARGEQRQGDAPPDAGDAEES